MGMILFISNILFYFTKNTFSILHFWDWTIQFTISDVASMKKSYKLIFLHGIDESFNIVSGRISS